MAAWLRVMVMSSEGNLEGARSIQLPTAEAQSIAETVDVIPLNLLARDHVPLLDMNTGWMLQ